MGRRRARWLAALAVGGCLLPGCGSRSCTLVGGRDSMQLTVPDAAGEITQVCQDRRCFGPPLDGSAAYGHPDGHRIATALTLTLDNGSILDRPATVTITTADGRTFTGLAPRPVTTYPNGKGCDPTVRTLTVSLV